MDDLLRQFGSREEAFAEIQRAAQRALDRGELNTIRHGSIVAETRLTVGGIEVDVLGGQIVDGFVRLSNASKRNIP